jgi:RNA polymerase sigma-70 factor (ECF subfamily)
MKERRLDHQAQPGPEDEQSLIERLRAREQAALGLLYDRYAGLVYALALRITGSPVEAQDVVVDSFWQVWQQADCYDQRRGQVAAWILTIARSRALDRARARRRSAHLVPEEQSAWQITARDNPEQDAWHAERARLVRAALAELTLQQREAIELAFYHGLSHTEIAERLGEPLGTIKTRIRLGLLKMREKLGGQLAPPTGRPAVTFAEGWSG